MFPDDPSTKWFRAATYVVALVTVFLISVSWGVRLALGVPPGHEIASAAFTALLTTLVERFLIID